MKHSHVGVFFGACFLLAGCMSQEAATIQPDPGFIRDLPNHAESKVRASVAVWLADESLSLRPTAEVQKENTAAIVSDGDMILRPEGSWVSLKVAYTMNVDVKDNRIRVRFSNLRRLYGSVSYQAPAIDDFFGSPPGAPFRREARARFITLVKSLTDFIGVPTRDVAALYE
jgi:hypothetical protein